MIEEERLPLSCDGWRLGDHFGDITEMVAKGIMPENLPPAENIRKPEYYTEPNGRFAARRRNVLVRHSFSGGEEHAI